MHHRPTRRWTAWPFPAVGTSTTSQTITVPDPEPTPDPLAEYRAEPPDADGIRRGLVARVRQLIADGAYDNPDCWAETENRLFRHADDRGR